MTSGASQRGCGLRPVTRKSRARPQGTPYADADRMQTSRGVAAELRAQARDPRVPAVGSVLATLAAAQGAPAATSSTRRPPAPIRLHECGRSTSAGAKASGSTSACAGRRHHVRQRLSRQQRAQLHGATCGCMLLEHPHKPSGSNPLQGRPSRGYAHAPRASKLGPASCVPV